MRFALSLVGERAVFGAGQRANLSGELKKWHKITLTFTGSDTGEIAEPNPFRNYRLNVTFAKDRKRYVVGSYYAANGNAGQTSASAGNSSAAFTVRWYNPRTGGPLRIGTVGAIAGPGPVAIGHPPATTN